MLQNLGEAANTVAPGKLIALNASIKKGRKRFQVNDLHFLHKKLQKEKIEAKVVRKKEIEKIIQARVL